ncbi:flagellar hook-basal body complex protein, partial [Alphaproteobacteria bacterium]|nr:flagellar hook-basal body complex protein [Alphaproteobacteria bacterium]
IGSTEIAYSAISGNSLTIASTDFSGANAIVDDTAVSLVTFSEGVFSNFKDKLRNTSVSAVVTSSSPDVSSGTAALNVGSTAGFPDTGTILVGSEKMTYTAKTATAFTIAQNGRGADNTSAFTGPDGDLIGSITATQTSITIDTIANGPYPVSGTLLIGTEQITYTGLTTSGSEVTFTGLTRGANGTTAATGSTNGTVTLLPEVSLVESVETLGMETRTTLINDSANITSTATTITVDDTSGFEDNGYLRIENELIHYTGKTATSFTGLTRGAGGTTQAAHNDNVAIFQDLSVTDDWVDENDPALKIAYDISGQNFTLQGIPSKIGTSTPSKMFSFSAFGPGEGNKANAIGLKTLSNKASSNIGGGAVLKAESVLFTGDQIAADTQQAFGVEVSYNNLTRKFSIASGSTGENIPANSAVGVGDSGQASSNIEIGRLAIVDGVATASTTGTGGTSALLGINATTNITTVTADTAGKGIQSQPAVLTGKTSNEDLSEDFFLSDAAEETIFVVNVNDITAAIQVPEGVYNGTSLATALQSRINQMEDSSGNTVNGVTVEYITSNNSFKFTTGTTGLKSKIFVSASARMGLDDLTLVTGTTPSFVNMANATATSATGQTLYVDDDGTTTTLAPESAWTPTTDGTFAKVFLRPGELTFDTQGNLVSPIQKVGYKGDFAADAAADRSALSIDLDLNFDGSTQFASDFNVKSVTQDGQTVGKLDGLDIAANGLVSANYTNGLNIALGRLVMVNFNNQNGLKQIGNATYVETSVSGVAAVGEAGADGYGTILSGSLERSNVDITEELVNLITAQRNFQANAKTIETNTSLTQAIIQIRT